MSANSNKTNISNIQTLLLLIEHTIGLISENNTNAQAKIDSVMYLNALEKQLGPSVITSYVRNAMIGPTRTTGNILPRVLMTISGSLTVSTTS